MRIVTTAAGPRVEEPERLDALSVGAPDGQPGDAGLSRLLGDLGTVDGEHVWLDVARLRALAQPLEDGAWGERFDGMIAYARSKGWVQDDPPRVRAHIDA